MPRHQGPDSRLRTETGVEDDGAGLGGTVLGVPGALTIGANLAGWWTSKVEIEERTDGVIRFTFAGDFHPEMQQTTLEPGQRVEWRCTGGHAN